MVNKLINLILLLLIYSNALLALETIKEQKNDTHSAMSTEVTSCRSATTVAIRTKDGVIVKIPENIAQMSATLNAILLELKEKIILTTDEPQEIFLSTITYPILEVIINFLQILDELEQKQLAGDCDKKASIKRADGLYILQTVYNKVILQMNSSIKNYTGKNLIELLDAVFYLDIVGTTTSQPVFTEIIIRQLVANYINENHINIDNVPFPTNSPSNKLFTKLFHSLFDQIVNDLHPLITQYIILQKIGADGKFDIADYITLFSIENISSNNIINLTNKKLTSLEGIELLPQSKIIDLSNNYLTILKNNSFTSQRYVQTINLSNNWLYDIAADTFSCLLSLKYLYLQANQISYIKKLSLHNLPLKYLGISENPLYTISENNISPKLRKIELSFPQLKTNISLLKQLCPKAKVSINTSNDPEAKAIIETINKMNNIRLNTTNFDYTQGIMVQEWFAIFDSITLSEIVTICKETVIITAQTIVKQAIKKAGDIKQAYCSIQ